MRDAYLKTYHPSTDLDRLYKVLTHPDTQVNKCSEWLLKHLSWRDIWLSHSFQWKFNIPLHTRILHWVHQLIWPQTKHQPFKLIMLHLSFLKWDLAFTARIFLIN